MLFIVREISIPNSPSSQTFAGDGTFGNGKFGVGFQALNDQTSYFTTTALSASFAYHITFSEKWKLGLGGQGGINVLPISVNRILLRKIVSLKKFLPTFVY